MKLALLDNNAANLAKAKASLLESATADVETYEMDVSQLAQWTEVKAAVTQRFGGVDFLMLNAGVGVSGGWEDVEYFRKVCCGLAEGDGEGLIWEKGREIVSGDCKRAMERMC